jgi:hypothetical protein
VFVTPGWAVALPSLANAAWGGSLCAMLLTAGVLSVRK